MKRLFTATLLVLSSLGISSILSSCSSTEKKDSDDPKVVYEEGTRLAKEHDYLIAEEYFSEVRRRFPQSRYSTLAQLASADLDYEQDNYLEAATAYGFFVDQFPRHEEAARAEYRRADSFFKAAPENIARDQSQINDAIAVCRDFMKRYATSNYKDQIVKILEQSRLRLAEKEAYVAAFYERKDHHLAALRRWKGLERDYGDISATDQGSKLLQRAVTRIAVLEKVVDKE